MEVYTYKTVIRITGIVVFGGEAVAVVNLVYSVSSLH